MDYHIKFLICLITNMHLKKKRNGAYILLQSSAHVRHVWSGALLVKMKCQTLFLNALLIFNESLQDRI